MVSNVFIDTYMKEANGEYVKIYLYLLRCLGQREIPFSIPAMADKLEYTEADIRRALAYWERQGLLRLERDPSENLRGICLLDPSDAGCPKDDAADPRETTASAETSLAEQTVSVSEGEEALPTPRSYTPEERDALQSDPESGGDPVSGGALYPSSSELQGYGDHHLLVRRLETARGSD